MNPEEIFKAALAENRKHLSLLEAFEVIESYGLPLARYIYIKEGDEIKDIRDLSFPVVLKADSPDIVHKTELGAVKANIRSLDELKTAISQMRQKILEKNPAVKIRGYIVQEQVSNAHEVIIGGLNDEQFGPVVAFGLGGIFVEILKDVVFDIAPITIAQAQELILKIKGYQILEGYRGLPKANIKLLAEVLSKASQMFAENAKYIKEMDLNPTFVSSEWVKIADARFALK
ncbi:MULTISPECIES: acetate--CoA ligase family protein [Thermofilum]|jgi:acyl-CoA synthetase (NDP forming)|nr:MULTISPECIES: acetate--CoA ligase family protein [Thermofilum]AJB42423.1 Acetyl-CoA synthetase (ADP-forming) beta chain [Thermofilum adornatum 1505]